MLCIRLFEQSKRFVFVVNPGVNASKHIKISIGMSGQFLKLVGDLQRITPSASNRVSPTMDTGNKLVLCRYRLVLIRNLIEFGESFLIHVFHGVGGSQSSPDDSNIGIEFKCLLILNNRFIVSSREKVHRSQLGNYVR